MKAAVVLGAGQNPSYGDFPEPICKENEVKVNVIAAALTPLAKARAAGTHYSSGGAYPFVAGADGVGHLDDGTRVFFLLPKPPQGAMAERITVPNGQWLRLPDSIDDLSAASIANAGMSSWAALVQRARIKSGQAVLVNGATGASGQLAVRIARHLGASRVIATGRNEKVLNALGADSVVLLSEDIDAFEAAVAEQFKNGIDIVLDYLWGASARAILLAAAKIQSGTPTRFVQIGSVTGEEVSLPARILRSSGVEMLGSGIGSLSLEQLMLSVSEMLNEASSAQLSLEYSAVPLINVGSVWGLKDGRRYIFTMK
ncbi:zinc-binding alcohol dehydrogenase family protein [Pseudomonas oryzihabitans]|uniref:Alcohol dehydrogenase n=1 Tax=Pseudomonas oryzihabitans TaxID=47885 RepID=A0A2Z5AAF6_9PSED|nr:zinc-binding alcohol dehydrogenase family protein [Pseudomonas oryzihabitans]AXA67838.1 alcohol dehydrogenase [Pseudomonas oryzihabitans]